MNSFSVTLPLPPRECSPNARLHWAPKARATRAARRVAWYWFQREKPAYWTPKPVTLEITYHCPRSCDGYRPRDVQNAIAALKPMVDGMVDAGIVLDDSAEWVSWGVFDITRRRIEGRKPGVTVTVRPL